MAKFLSPLQEAETDIEVFIQFKGARARQMLTVHKITDEAIKQEIGEGKDIVSVLSECFCLIVTSGFRGADAVDGVQ